MSADEHRAETAEAGWGEVEPRAKAPRSKLPATPAQQVISFAQREAAALGVELPAHAAPVGKPKVPKAEKPKAEPKAKKPAERLPWPGALDALADMAKANGAALEVFKLAARAEVIDCTRQALRHLEGDWRAQVDAASSREVQAAFLKAMGDLSAALRTVERDHWLDGRRLEEPIAALADVERLSAIAELRRFGHDEAANMLAERGLYGERRLPLPRPEALLTAIADKSEVRDRSYDEARRVGANIAGNLQRLPVERWADVLALVVEQAKRAGAQGAPLCDGEAPEAMTVPALSPEVAVLVRAVRSLAPLVQRSGDGSTFCRVPWLSWTDVTRALDALGEGGS